MTLECSGDPNDPLVSHLPLRALCEILYTCGLQERPVLCECHDTYNFPKPIATGNRTYKQASPEK